MVPTGVVASAVPYVVICLHTVDTGTVKTNWEIAEAVLSGSFDLISTPPISLLSSAHVTFPSTVPWFATRRLSGVAGRLGGGELEIWL
jgi:hypothetical protein